MWFGFFFVNLYAFWRTDYACMQIFLQYYCAPVSKKENNKQ